MLGLISYYVFFLGGRDFCELELTHWCVRVFYFEWLYDELKKPARHWLGMRESIYDSKVS